MNQLLERMIKELPQSPTPLTKKNIKKIHRILPVPNEYEILWADIASFKEHPAGVILTDKAFIVKASKSELKKNKKEKIKRKNKKKDKSLKEIYQIIPWEYYNPEEYDIKLDEKKKRYILCAGDTAIASFNEKSLYNLILSYKQKVVENNEKAEAAFGSMDSVNAEDIYFNAIYGKANHRFGHGIYAEEYGGTLDKLNREKVKVVGRDNAKNGPDKIVDGFQVQCKYCRNANDSVNACFKKNPRTGVNEFRYYDLSGKPMKVEVPADQYIDSVESMKKKITDGQVNGVSDPNEAYSIIRKGKLTYKQAVDLAKAGTIESIKFDVKNGVVDCLSALGVSAVVSFAQLLWVTKDYKKAAKGALSVGLQVYGWSFAGGILASQISRTSISSAFNPLANDISDLIGPSITQDIINGFRTLAGKKPIYGAAAQKSFSKFMGSTVLTQSIMIFAFSVPDTYRVMRGRITGAQYCKNLTTTIASALGSKGASVLTGVIIGKKFGDKTNSKVVKVVSMGAGAVGGAVVRTTVKGVGKIVREDDAIITMRLFNALLQNRFMDNLLLPDEQDKVISMINEDGKKLQLLLQKTRKSKTQEQDIVEYIDKKIEIIIQERSKLGKEGEEKMNNSIASVVIKGDLSDEED